MKFLLGLALLAWAAPPLTAAPPPNNPSKTFELPTKVVPSIPVPTPPPSTDPAPAQDSLPIPGQPSPAITAPERPGEKPRLDHIVQLSDTSYRIGKIELDQKTRTVTFPAAVNMAQGMLEYALVTETGKVHEALLSTPIAPFDLNVALLLLHYREAQNFFPPEMLSVERQPAPNSPPTVPDETNSIDVKIHWKDQEGREQTAFLEEWIRNEALKKPAQRAPWVYTGSQIDASGIFAAQMNGSIIALFTDTLAMMNNPREGNESDEIWLVGPNVPAVQTPVRVTLHPHQKPAAPANGN